MDTLLGKLPEPSVSDICDEGRETDGAALGEAGDWPRPCTIEVAGNRGLWKEKDPKYGDLGEVGVFSGGCGAGLGLTNLSGSSATSARLGLNDGGVVA
jgi:hypothetical protein